MSYDAVLINIMNRQKFNVTPIIIFVVNVE